MLELRSPSPHLRRGGQGVRLRDMGFARSLLLKASRSQWLARQLRERRFFQRAVKRFMPGETLDDALEAAGQFTKASLGAVLTELGEQVTNRAEAAAVRDHYLGVFEKIQRSEERR